jgi:hypothetical protein
VSRGDVNKEKKLKRFSLGYPIVTPKWTKDRKKLLMGYLEGDNKLEHRKYAIQYFFFESLYFIIAVGSFK